MKCLLYSVKPFELSYLNKSNRYGHTVEYAAKPLNAETAALAKGFECISIFTGDDASAPVLEKLSQLGIQFIATRAAGYDNIDLEAAGRLQIKVANVPAYSPHAIAEHAVAMMLTLNRRLVRADRQVKAHDFRVDDLIGFDLHNKVAGIIGTGRIGQISAKILDGFGCRLLAYDVAPQHELEEIHNLRYASLPALLDKSDIITLHVPLNEKTRHLINEEAIALMKPGVMLINTARGPVVDTSAVLKGLRSGQIGYYGMDVYEKEKGVFFYDHSGENLNDPVLDELIAHPNVLVTPHQAFATGEAITNICDTTFETIQAWSDGRSSSFELVFQPVHAGQH